MLTMHVYIHTYIHIIHTHRGNRLEKETGLADRIQDAMRLGVHWDTQVGRDPDLRVCQVCIFVFMYVCMYVLPYSYTYIYT